MTSKSWWSGEIPGCGNMNMSVVEGNQNQPTNLCQFQSFNQDDATELLDTLIGSYTNLQTMFGDGTFGGSSCSSSAPTLTESTTSEGDDDKLEKKQAVKQTLSREGQAIFFEPVPHMPDLDYAEQIKFIKAHGKEIRRKMGKKNQQLNNSFVYFDETGVENFDEVTQKYNVLINGKLKEKSMPLILQTALYNGMVQAPTAHRNALSLYVAGFFRDLSFDEVSGEIGCGNNKSLCKLNKFYGGILKSGLWKQYSDMKFFCKKFNDKTTTVGLRFDFMPPSFVLPLQEKEFLSYFAKMEQVHLNSSKNSSLADGSKFTTPKKSTLTVSESEYQEDKREFVQSKSKSDDCDRRGGNNESVVAHCTEEVCSKLLSNRDPNFWISKPSGKASGNGIKVLEPHEVKQHVEVLKAEAHAWMLEESKKEDEKYDQASKNVGNNAFRLGVKDTRTLADQHFIISKYIHNPLLYENKRKFDLRIYVCVTSYDPLKIYLHKFGKVRFASCDYTLDDVDKHCHLTNVSFNKRGDEHMTPKGFDWLHEFLREIVIGRLEVIAAEKKLGKEKEFRSNEDSFKPISEHDIEFRVREVWGKIIDLIIKSQLCIQQKMIESNGGSTSKSHQIFGYDVMLDINLKPWLLEINFDPALNGGNDRESEAQQIMIKKLHSDALNLVGIFPHTMKPANGQFGKKKYSTINQSSKESLLSLAKFQETESHCKEFVRCKEHTDYIRIFPREESCRRFLPILLDFNRRSKMKMLINKTFEQCSLFYKDAMLMNREQDKYGERRDQTIDRNWPECPGCGRRFTARAFQIHSKICKATKNHSDRRKPFDSFSQRWDHIPIPADFVKNHDTVARKIGNSDRIIQRRVDFRKFRQEQRVQLQLAEGFSSGACTDWGPSQLHDRQDDQ